jgi:hypothetical protein
MSQEKPKPAYYSIIPASVRYDKSLHPNAKILYSEITCLCQKEGYCWASNSYFSELFDVSDRSIINWINNLREKQYIKTQLIFKKGSKEIKERRIYISDPLILKNLQNTESEGGEKNFSTPGENQELDPDEKKFTTGGEKNFTAPTEEKFQPPEKNFTHNNKPLSSLISISSEEEAKKYFSDNNFKSNAEDFWDFWESTDWMRGNSKIKNRAVEAKRWEINFKKKNPNLYKTTLTDENSASIKTIRDKIAAKIDGGIVYGDYDKYFAGRSIEKTETGFRITVDNPKAADYKEILDKLGVEICYQ